MPIILSEKIAKKFIHSNYFCAIKIQNLRDKMKYCLLNRFFFKNGICLKWSLMKKLKLNEYYNNFLTELGLFHRISMVLRSGFSTAVSEVVAVRSLLVVTVVSVSVIAVVLVVITTETTEVVSRLVGAHGVGRVSVELVVSVVVAPLELTVVSVVLSISLRFSISLGFSLRFSLSLTLVNSVVPVLVVLVSKVRSVGTVGRVRSGVGRVGRVGAHGVGRVDITVVLVVSVVSLELTVVSVVLSISLSFSLSLGFSLRFSLSLSLENSVVSIVIAVVLVVVSEVRSAVSRHVALGEDGVVVVGLVGSIIGPIVGPIAVESSGAPVITLSCTVPRSKIARFSLGLGLRLGNSRSNEKCKYLLKQNMISNGRISKKILK